MPTRTAVVACVLVLGLAGSLHAAPVLIDFDDLPASDNNLQPGNTYDSLGVHISTLNSIPATVDAVGDVFATTPLSDTFWRISNANAISPPNFAAATNGGAFDVLFSFASPIFSFSLQTDDAVEPVGDIVRLLALRALGGGTYEVLAVDVGLDNQLSSPGNVLEVFVPGGFLFAIFQTTTEQEGFDNLIVVPEPGLLTLGGFGIVAAFARTARARRRRNMTARIHG
ncbi:MAG TPA: hypothetical protein VJ717_00545 [Gemmatimonadaceae bacterium]|nr:hypothetical protein [Gemmatimonadaceae bacterium]